MAAGFDCNLIQVIKRLIDLIFCRKVVSSLSDRISLVREKGAILRSEEVGLAHDAHEFIFADLAVAVTVSLLDHLLDLVVSHVLAELLSHAL